jgi:hypothetical protein
MHGTNLALGRALFTEMAERLQGTPTRLVKFGSDKTVLLQRAERFAESFYRAMWDAR